MDHTHRWTVTVLRLGDFRLDGGGMFGLIPKTQWSQWVTPDALNRIQLACNALLLRDGARTVLVETGYGDRWTDEERASWAFAPTTATSVLNEHGVDARDVTDVIVTHLHFDHAAGLSNAQGELAFPNARVHVQRTEWEDALANKSTMTRTYLRSFLDPIAPRVVLHDGAAQPLPGIDVRPLPGHTWGSQGVFVESTDAYWVFPGDLMPTRHHIHPSSSLGYDMLPYETMVNKRAFLQSAAERQWRIVLDHDPEHAVVSVVRDGRRMTLVPTPPGMLAT